MIQNFKKTTVHIFFLMVQSPFYAILGVNCMPQKSLFWSPVQPFVNMISWYLPKQIFSNENNFLLILCLQSIGEVKNKCYFENVLGRMAEERVTKNAGKSDQKRLFYGTLAGICSK